MTIKTTWLIAGGATPELANRWVEPLYEAMLEYKVNLSTQRASMFLAQVLHESGGLTRIVENLNYSAGRLMEVWRQRFPTMEIAQQYEHQPEKLANFVYAGRMGNGQPSSGDGWRYRGRGLIQITGKANYSDIQRWTTIECVQYPELLELPKYAARSACAYWSMKGLNGLADTGNFDLITVRINGGLVGSGDRHERWDAIQTAMET